MKSKLLFLIFFFFSLAAQSQTNLTGSATASADLSSDGSTPASAIDGVSNDNTGWKATAINNQGTGATNIAPFAVATASEFDPGNEPEDAIDGITGDWTGWAATATPALLNRWLELTWATEKAINKVVLHTTIAADGNYAIKGYTIQYWDGFAYQDLATVTGNASAIVTSAFETVVTSKIRILCTVPDLGSSYYRISELQVYSDVEIVPHWLELTWPTDQTIRNVTLFTNSNSSSALRDYDIQYWNGTSFQNVASVAANINKKISRTFAPVTTTKLRIFCRKPGITDFSYGINEVEVYDAPPALEEETWNMDFAAIDENFLTPPDQYRMLSYYMNKDLQQQGVDELLGFGYGGVMSSTPYANYLQDQGGWDQVDQDVDLAHNSGLYTWLSDELGYPSGAAGGLVVEGHPEYENRGVVRIYQEGTGTAAATMSLPADLEFFKASLYPIVNGNPDFSNAIDVPITGNQIATNGITGEWQLAAFGIKILDEDTQAQSTVEQFGNTGHYPSLLSAGAMQRFIDVTHQEYADRIDNFGEKVDVFYTNEPNLQTTYWNPTGQAEYAYLPWEADLANQFQMMHGYDLVPRLNALFEGNSVEEKMIRLHYFQTVGAVMAKNFSGKITEWCHENGVKSSGHPLLEEYLACHVANYGDFMQVMREFDIPSCDLPIARPTNTNWEYWMPKVVSSASYLEGAAGVVAALIDPIIDFGISDLSPDIPILKRTFNMSFLCGVNQLTSYIPYQEYVGAERQEHKEMSDYLARIALMLRGAKNEAPIAMYYPVETIQSKFTATPLHWQNIIQNANFSASQATLKNLATGILENGLDFNYVTADVILDATIEGSTVKIGLYNYSSIVMPRVEVIPLVVLQKLQTFVNAGIPVYWVDALPSLGTKMGDEVAVQQIASTLTTNNAPISNLVSLDASHSKVHFATTSDKLFMSRFTRNGSRIYYVINDSNQPMTLTVSSDSVGSLRMYNPTNGEISEVTLPLSQPVAAYNSLLFVEENVLLLGQKDLPEIKPETLQLYPNPSADYVTIKVPKKWIGEELQIVTIDGKVVENHKITQENIIKNVCTFPAGLYLIGIKGQPRYTKFVKN